MRSQRIYVRSWPARSNFAFNPFQKLMSDALESTGMITVEEFGPVAAIFSRADIWHWHWPDGQFAGGFPTTLAKYLWLRFLLAVARMRRIRIVWTAHNVDAHESRHPRLEESFRRLFLRRVSGFHFLSDYSRQLLVERYPDSIKGISIVTVHPDYSSIASPVSRQQARKRLGIDHDGPIVGFVGTVSRYKGVTRLVDVYISQSVSPSAFQLLIAGKPNADLKDWVDSIRNTPGIIVVDRQLSQEDLTAAYCASDVIALPYENITNSGSAVMAMTLGIPLLVPDRPPMRELAGKAPAGTVNFLDDPLTSESLLSGLHTGSAWHSRNGGPLPGFSWSEIAPSLQELYLRVLDRD